MNFAFNWMSLVNIFIFLVILCLTISIHELGHLLFIVMNIRLVLVKPFIRIKREKRIFVFE